MILHGRALTPGVAEGHLALLYDPLSLWGGFDLETGRISDVSHPDHGRALGGKILAMPSARGSSSSSSALVEAARRGCAPLAIILQRVDPILIIGSLVAADLYGIAIPVILLSQEQWPALMDGAPLSLDAMADVATLHFNS